VSQLAVTKRFGGNASSTMSGKQPSATGHWAEAVRIARTRRLTNQIAWPRRTPICWHSGIERETVIFERKTLALAAIEKSGGNALRQKITNGRPR
jgi:hypothetical protein